MSQEPIERVLFPTLSKSKYWDVRGGGLHSQSVLLLPIFALKQRTQVLDNTPIWAVSLTYPPANDQAEYILLGAGL